jgi:A/G-specific adenine glycosylase
MNGPPTFGAVPPFAQRVCAWQKACGRRDLPWQGSRDPYRVWVSEIMLQQTQVATVVPYYERFLAHFPTLAALAAAPEEAVLALWSGLGYYARARHLHRAARLIQERHGGVFPASPQAIAALPGVGRSTAAAIAVFAFGARAAILDGNVKRVLVRHAGIDGHPGEKSVSERLWQLAEARLPTVEVETYTQGLMDLGALVCTPRTPRCGQCPVAQDCVAYQEDRVATLPSRRPKRALPEREVTWLIVLCGEAVLLERRAPSGIWGGLWTPPEVAVGVDAERLARQHYRLIPSRMEELPPLVHTFTHFRLRARPLLLYAEAAPMHVAERGLLWLPLNEIANAPLPAPVKTLLARLSGRGSLP